MSSKHKRYYRPELASLNIPGKANRILNIILIVMIMIVVRIWHLTVIQYELKIDESRKPQRKIVIEPAKRGTIRDRYNIPLAINKIQYQAAVVYSQLKEIPALSWTVDPDGKKVRRYNRREYITKLAELLAKELNLSAERIEDLIYSKASFYFQYPFVIKEDLSETEYYRLKMLEKDWLGIHVQAVPKRVYPKNKVAADVVGYMGAINKNEYEKIIREIKNLHMFVQDYDNGKDPIFPDKVTSYDGALERIQELEAYAYTINDSVGKGGIEGKFEQFLRGYHGKKTFYSDARGNFLRELPGTRQPLSGQRILLTISSELQEYAEKLLAQNERIRQAQVSGVERKERIKRSQRQPWIKGGAVVAMEPETGDIIALASYPRFDPNDFISSSDPEINKQKKSNVVRWFESEYYLADIWDQKRSLERERYDDEKEEFFDDKQTMDWKTYLGFILPQDNPVKKELQAIKTIEEALKLQNAVERLLGLSEQEDPYWLFNSLYTSETHYPYKQRQPTTETKNSIERHLKEHAVEIASIRKQIDTHLEAIPNNYDKVLLVDLCRMAVPGHLFTPELRLKIGQQSLEDYRNASAAISSITEVVHGMSKDLFHELSFKPWRKSNEKLFLKQKRLDEKLAKVYPKPYIEYLDSQEKALFHEFWVENADKILTLFLTGKLIAKPTEELLPYYEHFLSWQQELQAGAHKNEPWTPSYQILKQAVANLEIPLIPSYLQTLRSYHQLNRPLLGRYRHLRKDSEGKQLEKHLAAAFYPMYGYGYGRSQGYRQAATQGSIFKLITAYEALIQRIKKMKGEVLTLRNLNPLEIVDTTHRKGKEIFVGFTQDGTPIPQQYKGGRLLKSAAKSIGRLDLLKALETSSNPYFSLLAGDILNSPDDLARAARQFSYGSLTGIDLPAEIPGKVPEDLIENRTGLYAMANGQHSLVVTPLQTAVFLSALANKGKILKPNIVKLTVANKFHVDEKKGNNVIRYSPIEIKRMVFLPDIVRTMLIEGMRRVVHKQHKDNIQRLSNFYRDYPEAISDYIDLKNQFVGKTSTSESMENIDLDTNYGTNLYTHVWFGGIAFDQDIKSIDDDLIVFADRSGKADLVVIVYLRYGAYGNEAAPLAAQIVKKWREIKSKYE